MNAKTQRGDLFCHQRPHADSRSWNIGWSVDAARSSLRGGREPAPAATTTGHDGRGGRARTK